MKEVVLNNGVHMPMIGLGVMKMRDIQSGVVQGIENGYRLIDTAASYQNEEAVGNAIKLSPVKRENLFITSKVKIQKLGYEGTMKAFEQTLAKLQTDYLDLYLIHHPFGDVFGEWRAMEELYAQKKIRAIGVANFEPFQLVNLINYSDVRPAVNQIEINPRYQETTQHQFNQDNDIQTEAWSPFISGQENIFENPVLKDIADKYHKTVAQVILRWITQRGIVVIPKTNNPVRMRENFDIFDFKLDADDLKQIVTLEKGKPTFLNHLDPHDAQTMIDMVGK